MAVLTLAISVKLKFLEGKSVFSFRNETSKYLNNLEQDANGFSRTSNKKNAMAYKTAQRIRERSAQKPNLALNLLLKNTKRPSFLSRVSLNS